MEDKQVIAMVEKNRELVDFRDRLLAISARRKPRHRMFWARKK